MPFLAGAIVPILTGVAAASTIGTSIYSLVNQPSSGSSSNAEQKALNQQQQADQQARQKAILASLPEAQEQGGGALSQPSLLNLGTVIAGLPGESTTTPPGAGALASYLGLPSNTPVNSSGDLVSNTYGLSGSQG